jgi:hypothetical protein
VTFPTVIQLNHPDYVPFFIEIEPDQYLTNTGERKVEAPPHIYLSSFSIGIKYRTHARTRGPFALYDVEEKDTEEVKLRAAQPYARSCLRSAWISVTCRS